MNKSLCSLIGSTIVASALSSCGVEPNTYEPEVTEYDVTSDDIKVTKADTTKKLSSCITTRNQCPSTSISDYPSQFSQDTTIIYGMTPESRASAQSLADVLKPCKSDNERNIKIISSDDISKASTTDNLLIIGNSCFNKGNALLRGLEFPSCSYGNTDMLLQPGWASVEIYNIGRRKALLVYGYSREDTLNALKLLKNYRNFTSNIENVEMSCSESAKFKHNQIVLEKRIEQ